MPLPAGRAEADPNWHLSPIDHPSLEVSVVVDDNLLAREFVSFCLERRGHKWPELYDEMCQVASYRLFRDMGYRELNDHGVSLSLSNMDTLAALADTLTSSQA